MSDEELKFFTVAEVAKILHCGPESVRNYIKQKKLKAKKVIRRLLISKANLKEFLNSNDD